jgi:hypothetical protein
MKLNLQNCKNQTAEPFKQHAKPCIVHPTKNNYASVSSDKRCQLATTHFQNNDGIPRISLTLYLWLGPRPVAHYLCCMQINSIKCL